MRSRSSTVRAPALPVPVLVAAVMIAILALPLLAFQYLPLTDLPNYQARLWLESSLAKTPELAQYFRIAWHPAPTLALDLTMLPLVGLIGTALATRVFLVATLVVLAAGLLLVNRSIADRADRASPCSPLWPLTGLLFFYSKILTLGFISFLATAAAGLLLIALGLHWRGRRDPWRVAILLICALALLFGHAHAFACAGLALAAAEFAAQRRAASSLAGTVAGVGLAAAPFVAALAIFAVLPGRYRTGLGFAYNLPLKGDALWSLLQLYDDRIETLVLLGAAASFLFGCWRGWIIVPPETRWMAAALFAAFLVLPFTVGGSSFADYRLPVFIVWVVIAGSLVPVRARQPLWPAVFLLALAAAQSGYIASRWSAFQPAYAAVDAALDPVGPGTRVLVVSHDLGNGDPVALPPLLHAPLRAVWRRHALVSGLFLSGGLPVEMQPDYAHLALRQNWWRPILGGDSPSVRRAFFDDDRLRGYQYLLVLLPGPIATLVPGKFRLVTKSHWAALYDMRQPPAR